MEQGQPGPSKTRASVRWNAALAFELVAPLLIGIAVLIVLVLAVLLASPATD